MLILGLCGGSSLPHEATSLAATWQHDAAAVLVEDGVVVAAAEEERLNRIKHTNSAPVRAARFCLDQHGATAADLDAIAFSWDDGMLDHVAQMSFLRDATKPELRSTRSSLRDVLARHAGLTVPAERFHFVRHHMAHAVSAFAHSGFERSLVVTLDGQGDCEAGLIAVATRGRGIEPVRSVGIKDSLGYLYQDAIMFLGYRMFDEYKVMGLAPYGDPCRYRDTLKTLYTLLPDGGWQLHRERLCSLYGLFTPRRRGEEFTQVHKDFAAGVQAMLEEIAFHMLQFYRRQTNEPDLCLAGGVAHNCTLNGRILASGLFDRVFVQPAAHDPGAAIGAALHVYLERQRHGATTVTASAGPPPVPPLRHVFWGPPVGDDHQIQEQLEPWREFVSFERVGDICGRAAALMAEGNVIGWVQGRSEFGPRALGNRSIVADPRPAANKSRINAMIKKREGYRPFAPSVLVEAARDYFQLPAGDDDLSYMVFVVPVREEQRTRLGAITHVDGSARVQTVSRETNERYWSLIAAFRTITGVPMLLNTSFNNDVEPIVDSVTDAVVCYLTTDLNYLAVGNWLVRKRPPAASAWQQLKPSLPAHVRLTQTTAVLDRNRLHHTYELASTTGSRPLPIARATYEVLKAADGRPLQAICSGFGYGAADVAHVAGELQELWARRAITLTPA
jgi:carbamoyltransferase